LGYDSDHGIVFSRRRPLLGKPIDSTSVSFRAGWSELSTGAAECPDLRFVVSTFIYSDGSTLGEKMT
jgi:hypothetical protein